MGITIQVNCDVHSLISVNIQFRQMDAAAANGARRGRRVVYVRVQMCEKMCHVSDCVCVCVCVCECVCVRACVCGYARAWVSVRVRVRARVRVCEILLATSVD